MKQEDDALSDEERQMVLNGLVSRKIWKFLNFAENKERQYNPTLLGEELGYA